MPTPFIFIGLSDELDELRNYFTSSEVHDSNWARKVNKKTSKIHLEIWSGEPPYEIVDTEIIPLLELARDGVSNARREGKYAEHIDSWTQHIANRIENTMRYTRNEHSNLGSSLTETAA